MRSAYDLAGRHRILPPVTASSWREFHLILLPGSVKAGSLPPARRAKQFPAVADNRLRPHGRGNTILQATEWAPRLPRRVGKVLGLCRFHHLSCLQAAIAPRAATLIRYASECPPGSLNIRFR